MVLVFKFLLLNHIRGGSFLLFLVYAIEPIVSRKMGFNFLPVLLLMNFPFFVNFYGSNKISAILICLSQFGLSKLYFIGNLLAILFFNIARIFSFFVQNIFSNYCWNLDEFFESNATFLLALTIGNIVCNSLFVKLRHQTHRLFFCGLAFSMAFNLIENFLTSWLSSSFFFGLVALVIWVIDLVRYKTLGNGIFILN